MSGSVEVRQFLLRYEGADGGSAPFAGALPAQRSGAADAQRVSDDQVRRARLAVFCYGRAHLRELARVIAATCEEADLVEVAGKLGATLFRQSREQEEVPQPRLHKRPVTLAKFVPSRFPAELYDNDDEAEPSHLQQ